MESKTVKLLLEAADALHSENESVTDFVVELNRRLETDPDATGQLKNLLRLTRFYELIYLLDEPDLTMDPARVDRIWENVKRRCFPD